jgi:hypothetical protein
MTDRLLTANEVAGMVGELVESVSVGGVVGEATA